MKRQRENEIKGEERGSGPVNTFPGEESFEREDERERERESFNIQCIVIRVV